MQAACIRWEVFRPAADGQNGMAVTGMCCGLTSKENGGNPGVRPWSISGSGDMYGGYGDDYTGNYAGYNSCVNFFTCHDGFTLYDLYAYDNKHNEANGWNNLDGHSDNRSWNCGAEGENQRSGSAETSVSYDSKCLCSAHVQPWNPHVSGRR